MYRYLALGRSPSTPPFTPDGDTLVLLRHLRERARQLHCSAQTEARHLRWARAFLRWQQAQQAPDAVAVGRDPELAQAFLNALAGQPGFAPAQHRHALQALLFLYREAWGCALL